MAAAQGQQPFSINVSVENAEVRVRSPLQVKIRLTNTSDHDLNASASYDGRLLMSYQCDVRDVKGSLVKTREHIAPAIGHFKIRTLKPGESATDMSVISEEFDLALPGEYVVQLSRSVSDDAADGAVTSNTITVT